MQHYDPDPDDDDDDADDDYDDYEFLTNPGLQGATEGCKAIAWAPTSRTRTPANLMMMIMLSDH